MNVVEKLYTEWAWRSKNGTPSFNNPEDKAILDDLVRELSGESLVTPENEETVITEKALSYEEAIRERFDGEIPEVYGVYGIPNQTTTTNVDSRDRKTFSIIYEIKPQGNATIGKGEVALYWLYSFQKSNVNVDDNRGEDDPDLKIGNTYVEVKAYKGSGKTSNKIKLGGISKEHRHLKVLKAIFSIQTLTTFFDPTRKEKKIILANNFLPSELVTACDAVLKLREVDFTLLANEYEIFRNIKTNLDTIIQETGNPDSARTMASRTLGELAKAKFSRKPGIGHFIVDVAQDGEMDWFMVTEEGLNKEDLIDYVNINNGILVANYKALFS